MLLYKTKGQFFLRKLERGLGDDGRKFLACRPMRALPPGGEGWRLAGLSTYLTLSSTFPHRLLAPTPWTRFSSSSFMRLSTYIPKKCIPIKHYVITLPIWALNKPSFMQPCMLGSTVSWGEAVLSPPVSLSCLLLSGSHVSSCQAVMSPSVSLSCLLLSGSHVFFCQPSMLPSVCQSCFLLSGSRVSSCQVVMSLPVR